MELFFNKFIPIENDKNYLPGRGILAEKTYPIVALHIIKYLTGDITVYNIDGEPTTYPPSAFAPGGIYNFPTAKIVYSNDEDNCAIYGCILMRKPF